MGTWLQVPVFVLAAVLILIAVGILVAVLGLIGFLIGILILIIHDFFLQMVLRKFRKGSMPDFSGFILGFENQTGQETCHDSSGDAAGGGFQTTGEDA